MASKLARLTYTQKFGPELLDNRADFIYFVSQEAMTSIPEPYSNAMLGSIVVDHSSYEVVICSEVRLVHITSLPHFSHWPLTSEVELLDQVGKLRHHGALGVFELIGTGGFAHITVAGEEYWEEKVAFQVCFH